MLQGGGAGGSKRREWERCMMGAVVEGKEITKKISYIDVRPNTPCSMARRQVTPSEAEDYGTGQTVGTRRLCC